MIKHSHLRTLLEIIRIGVVCILLLNVIAHCAGADAGHRRLAAEFQDPPMSSLPLTWWHWISGNITKDGITRDLEWMRDFGLSGAIVFNVNRLSDGVPRPVPFKSDEWWEMADYAISEANRLGLEIGFHNCDGWSHSGGPWIRPEDSMKKLVWTETFARAGEWNIILEQPETLHDFYREVAVLALPVQESSSSVPFDRLSSNQSQLNLDALQENNSRSLSLSNIRRNSPVHLDFHFDEPQTIASVRLMLGGRVIQECELSLEVSDNGEDFNQVGSISQPAWDWKIPRENRSLTFSFPEQETRYFRISFLRTGTLDLTDVQLYSTKRMEMWEVKGAHMHHEEHGGAPEVYIVDRTRHDGSFDNSAIDPEFVIDISDRLGVDNRLDWSPPIGHWRLLRIGYTTTGKTNVPATLEGRGLEADKMDPDALRKHWENYMGLLANREVNQDNTTLSYSQIDSWESGLQNWTSRMEELFHVYNGYDLRPFLPVLVGGHVIGSYEISERFLWDFRKTIAHLIRTGAFQTLSELAAEDGLAMFSEASGRGQYMYDPINYQSAAPIPMGEFWMGPAFPQIDCKVAASVANVYGGQLASSESFTGGNITWRQGPFDIKRIGDRAFTMGINHIVLHTSTHQPYNHLKPGFSLGNAGTHFHRNNIVYAASNAWTRYMARCQYMLRQGRFVADVLHFTGEDVPNYLGFRHELPVPLPEGYDYDGCNADILLNHARVEDGEIVLDSAMRYRVLLLPNRDAMSLELLTRIKELVSAGATVIGPRPQYAPGLRGYPKADQDVRKIAAQVWGDCDGVVSKEHRYGKGRVMWGKSFEEVFAALDLPPDFSFEAKGHDTPVIEYIHRRLDKTDIYFVTNTEPRPHAIDARFRVSDKVPHLYFPDSGRTISTAYYRNGEGFIDVPLRLDPYGSLFVVFKPGQSPRTVTAVEGPTSPRFAYGTDNVIDAEFFAPGKYRLNYSDGSSEEITVALSKPLKIDGPWDIRFPVTAEKPVKAVYSELFSWPQSEDPDIRYFSGTAVYSKTFDLPAGYRAQGQTMYLDLGEVQKIARVKVNGIECSDIWKPPYEIEVTNLLVTGMNRIEIEVTNTWANRIIGDAHLPSDLHYRRDLTALPEWLDGTVARESKRQTFTTRIFFDKNASLQPSGLLGPVTVNVAKMLALDILQQQYKRCCVE